MKCKYMFLFPMKNLARKELTVKGGFFAHKFINAKRLSLSQLAICKGSTQTICWTCREHLTIYAQSALLWNILKKIDGHVIPRSLYDIQCFIPFHVDVDHPVMWQVCHLVHACVQLLILRSLPASHAGRNHSCYDNYGAISWWSGRILWWNVARFIS